MRGVIALIDGYPALSGADFQVNTGEIVWLSGRNGSGKTTLLRACAGLMRITGERASVLGYDLLAIGAAGAQARRGVRTNAGLLGHVDALYNDLTVADQLAYNARLVRVDNTEIEAALEKVGLEGRLRAVSVRRLSAGQRRRLALAMMILKRPRLWLLDEPHAGLDKPGRAMVDELLNQAATAGATVVIAAHEHKPSSQQTEQVRQIVLAGGQARPAQPGEPSEQ